MYICIICRVENEIWYTCNYLLASNVLGELFYRYKCQQAWILGTASLTLQFQIFETQKKSKPFCKHHIFHSFDIWMFYGQPCGCIVSVESFPLDSMDYTWVHCQCSRVYFSLHENLAISKLIVWYQNLSFRWIHSCILIGIHPMVV